MGTYRHSTTAGHRQARRRATSAIATLAVMGILTACTAATAGVGAPGRAPGGYPTGAAPAIKAQTSPETQQSLRLEHRAKDDLLSVKLSGGAKAKSEYETLRAEHQPAK